MEQGAGGPTCIPTVLLLACPPPSGDYEPEPPFIQSEHTTLSIHGHHKPALVEGVTITGASNGGHSPQLDGGPVVKANGAH
jgi:hypothetical protein